MNPSALNIMNLLPVMILAGGILVILPLIAVERNHELTFASTLITLSASFIAILFMNQDEPQALGELFLFDRFAFYYQEIILLSAFVVTIFSFISLRKLFSEKRKEEYYLILLLATLGASMMVSCTHFISFFVSLELLTISLYSLISYYREQSTAIEAGLKYLIMAAVSSAFLLFGMALIYTTTGAMDFRSLAQMAPDLTTTSMLMMVAGAGMMVVGIGFKLGLVPFHMWIPDVYQGASSPASAFVATVSKGAMLAVLLRFFAMADLYRFDTLMMVFTVIAILSMLIGNLLALRQQNIKRMLAYSSIAHFGYLLIAVLAGKAMGMEVATIYITVYILAILIAFGLITLTSESDDKASDIARYKGMFWRKPLVATLFTISMLSLAGIPLTAGFMAKFFLLNIGVAHAQWLLAFTLVISSVIGLFYYLRVIVMMMKPEDASVPLIGSISSGVAITGILALTILGLLIVWLGIYPYGIIQLIGHLNIGLMR